MNLDWAWIERNLPMIGMLLVEHVILAVLPVVLAFVIGLPVGYLVSKTKRAANVILAFLGVIYSIPSLALFVLMPVVLGTKILNPINIVVALADLFDRAADPLRRGRVALGVAVGDAVRHGRRLRLAAAALPR